MSRKKTNKIRKRFNKLASLSFQKINSSIEFDKFLYQEDINASIAHATMLASQKIISLPDSKRIINGLKKILREIKTNKFEFNQDLEDIHMNIENRLEELIGDAAGRLHTARSRNDQVCLDMRLYLREASKHTMTKIAMLQNSLLDLGDKYHEAVIPGYTHLQKAQPVLFAHHILAYFEMFERDYERFVRVGKAADVLPLGSGALAGLPYPIDRDFVARELGFAEISRNSMDAVSDRDFVIDYLSAAATCAMHISRFSEELILWTTEEFSMVKLPSEYTTGSSIMPQKRNPDFAEISRGKTGRIYGNLISLLTVMKGLPLTYNRDLQEDKEGFFDSYDTLIATLEVFEGMLTGMSVNIGQARRSAEGGMVLATDIADYLVSKGLPFRESHSIVSRMSDYASQKRRLFSELSLSEYLDFSELFEEDVFDITVETSVRSKDVLGGTAPGQVLLALKEARSRLEAHCGA